MLSDNSSNSLCTDGQRNKRRFNLPKHCLREEKHGIFLGRKMVLATSMHGMFNSHIYYKAGRGATLHPSSLPNMTLSGSPFFISEFVPPSTTLYFPGASFSLHSSFFFTAEYYFTMRTHHAFIIYSSANVHLDYFHFFIIANREAVSVGVGSSLW